MGGNERIPEKSDLTFRQQSALPIIAASPSIAQAAGASGIGESTLRRWLEDDKFRDELTRLRQESASLARQELQGLMLRSVSVLADAMDHPDMAIRLRAARYSMSFAVRFAKPESSDRISKSCKKPSLRAVHHSRQQAQRGNPSHWSATLGAIGSAGGLPPHRSQRRL